MTSTASGTRTARSAGSGRTATGCSPRTGPSASSRGGTWTLPPGSRPRPCCGPARTRRRLILDNAHDAFVAMSADGLIAEWNRQAEITFGWPRAEAVGRVLSETIIPPQLREAHSRGLARFLATGEGPVLNRVIEVRALRRDGGEFSAEISIAPVRVGEQYLFAAFIRDVTERKQAEEELRRAKRRRRRPTGRRTSSWPWSATRSAPP